MKRISFILTTAAVAVLASCGNSTETTTVDTPAVSTETPPPAQTQEPAPTQTPAKTAPSGSETKVEVNKDGAKVEIKR